MAIKGDRFTIETTQEFYMLSVAEKGVVVVHSGAPSGAYLDQSAGSVCLPGGSPSGTIPVGILLNDFVNLDLTKYELNEQKDERQINTKATIMRKGWLVTNKVKSGDTPTTGADAYYAANGELSTTSTNSVKIGSFQGVKDNDGYVKVRVDL